MKYILVLIILNGWNHDAVTKTTVGSFYDEKSCLTERDRLLAISGTWFRQFSCIQEKEGVK